MSDKYASDKQMKLLFENFRSHVEEQGEQEINESDAINEFKLRDLVRNFLRKGKGAVAELPPEDQKDVAAAAQVAKAGSEEQKAQLNKALDQEVDEIDFLSQVADEQANYDDDGDAKIGAWDTSWLDKYDGDYDAYLKAEAPEVAALAGAVRKAMFATKGITGEDLQKDRQGLLFDNLRFLLNGLREAGFDKEVLVSMIK